MGVRRGVRWPHVCPHKKKADWNDWLESYDLGERRLAEEVDRGLTAKKTVYYQDEPLAEHNDNPTQQRARELLAKLLGKGGDQVDVTHRGSVELGVTIYLPDNGRDSPSSSSADDDDGNRY